MMSLVRRLLNVAIPATLGMMLLVAPVMDNVAEAREAAPTAFDPVANKRVMEVSEQLRCLVCQNQSIAESNAELAVDLRNQVIEQIRAGRTNQEIIDYMVDRYGDFVLYKPPFKLSTAILWIGPLLLFVVGLLAFFINVKRRKRLVEAAAKPLSAQEKALADELLSGRKE